MWLRGGPNLDRQAVTHRCAAYSRRGTGERIRLPEIGTLLRFARQQHRMALKFKLRGGECVDPHDLPGVRDILRPKTTLL